MRFVAIWPNHVVCEVEHKYSDNHVICSTDVGKKIAWKFNPHMIPMVYRQLGPIRWLLFLWTFVEKRHLITYPDHFSRLRFKPKSTDCEPNTGRFIKVQLTQLLSCGHWSFCSHWLSPMTDVLNARRKGPIILEIVAGRVSRRWLSYFRTLGMNFSSRMFHSQWE